MVIMYIFEFRMGHQKVTREIKFPKEYLSKVETYLYEKGATCTCDPMGERSGGNIYYRFMVEAPRLMTLIKEMKERWPIQVTEVKEYKK